MGKKEKAVVYARVSTDKEEQKTSIESQKEYYPSYIRDKGMEYAGLYYDEGLSATSSNRKDFIRMLYDAGLDSTRDGNLVTFRVNYDRDPLFNWIITKDHDRFARNIDTVTIVRALRDKDVYIEFENLGFTTKDIDWEFRLGLFLTFAQQESLDKSRKLKDAYYKRSKKGEFHMSVNLLGYGRDDKTKEYYIKEDEAEIIRKIFDYYTEGKIGSYEIGDILNEQGYKTKQGRNWNGNSVLRVLRNEKFKGQVILNRYGKTDITGSNKRVINPKSEWIVHDDALPKIVTVEQFDKAQKIMETRTRSTAKNKNSDKRQVRGKKRVKNIFHKKIFCGKCHADYIRESSLKTRADGSKDRVYTYGCRNRRNLQRNNEKCMNRGISHNVLVRELEKIGKNLHYSFNRIRITEEKQALDRILKRLDNKIKNSETEKEKIDVKINQLDEEIGNITNSIAKGVSESVSKIMFDKIEQIDNKKNKLESSKLEYDTISIERERQEYIGKFNDIMRFSKQEHFSFDDVLELVENIHVLPFRSVLVELKTPTLLLDDEIYKGETDYALLPFTFELSK